jgi:hypothetical protein
MSQKLYRPYLSPEEIEAILYFLSCNLSVSRAPYKDAGARAYEKLYKLKAQISLSLLKPSHTLQPSLSEKLGFASEHPVLSVSLASLWERKEKGEILSPEDLKKAKTYAWEQGLLSAIESANFEKELGL